MRIYHLILHILHLYSVYTLHILYLSVSKYSRIYYKNEREKRKVCLLFNLLVESLCRRGGMGGGGGVGGRGRVEEFQ